MINNYRLNLSKYSTHQIIVDNIGKSKKVLDVGCNDGYIGQNSNKSNKFWGLDYSENSIKEAKSYYEDAIVYDANKLETLPWNQKFDLIIFADILEHLIDPEKVLTWFVENYLNDSGMVIISLPNIANWQVRLKLLFGRFDYANNGIMDRTHFHLYTYKSAEQLINIANLSVVNKYGGANIFGPIIKFLLFLKPLLATGIILICKKK